MSKLALTNFFCAILLSLAVTSSRAASSETTYRTGPISSALGGAGRAAIDATEAGWLNPAALVHATSYHIAISHQQSHRDQGDNYRDFAIMLSDSGIDKLAAGSFSYVQRNTLRAGPGAVAAEQKDFQGSLASFIGETRASFGVTYRRLIHQQPGADVTQDTYSVGALVPFGEKSGLAIVGQDLAGSSASAPLEAHFTPNVALGFQTGIFTIMRVRADLIRPLRDNADGRNDIRLGVESWFRPDFAFRVGSAWLENRNETWLTTGVGFHGPKLSFGYSFEKEMRTTDGTRHTFDLWLPL